jgi:hypothetical protein
MPPWQWVYVKITLILEIANDSDRKICLAMDRGSEI